MMMLGTSLLPLAISYEPIQLILRNSSLPVKVCSSLVYFIVLHYAVATVISTLLFIFVFSEGILKYSSIIHFHKSSLILSPKLAFSICYKRFRNLQILVVAANHIQTEFFVALIFVGVLAGSAGAYMTFKLYSALNLFVYMIAPVTTISAFGLLLTFLNNFPYKNSNAFKFYWKQFVVRQADKRTLYACQAIGVDLGPYGLSHSRLGLLICDDIVKNYVNLVLLK